MVYKLLPVAIMAHNEEKVIERAVESILKQKNPENYIIKVIVVANGCNDRTGEIVKVLIEQHSDKVLLVSIKEKGKTRAINEAIGFFDHLCTTGFTIPYVIFFDADCEFKGKEVLINFIKRFEHNPKLCAVGADCVPDVFFNKRDDFVAEAYREIYELSTTLEINSISGMCYGIRLDVLKMIDFPQIQFAEDMFVSARLNGWFYKDRNIHIVFKTPLDLITEIKRRTRQEVSTQRYHKYYSFLKKKGIKVRLFENSLAKEFEWQGATADSIFNKWLKIGGLEAKVLLTIYVLVRLWAKIRAYIVLKKIKHLKQMDYWEVVR